jgi:hypothetical protein
MMNNSTSPNANHRNLQTTRVVPQNAILQRSNAGTNNNRQAQSTMQSRNNSRLNINNNSQITTTAMTSARVQSNSNSVSNLPKSTTTHSNQNSGQKSQFHQEGYLINTTSSPNSGINRNNSLPGLPIINTDPDTSKQPLHILTETSEGTMPTFQTPSPASHTISTTNTKPMLPSFTSGLSSPKEPTNHNQLSRILGNKNNNENNKPNVKSPPATSSFKGASSQMTGVKNNQSSGNLNKMPQSKPFSNFNKPSTTNVQNNNNKAGLLNVNRNIQARPQNFSISSPKSPGALTPKIIQTNNSTGNASNTPTAGYNAAIQSYLSTLGASNPLFLQALASSNPMYAQMLNGGNTPTAVQDNSIAPGANNTSVNKSTFDTNHMNSSGDQHQLNIPNSDPTFITKKLALQIPSDINDDNHSEKHDDSPRVQNGTGIVKFDLSQKKSLHSQHAHHSSQNNKSKLQPMNLSTTPLKYEFDDAHKGKF